MSKTTCRFYLVIAACALLVSGCATPGPQVVPPSAKIPGYGVDTEDFAVKAEEMVGSMLESAVFDKAKEPCIIGIGLIKNDTAAHFDTDLLVKKIRVRLNKSNKARTDTTGGVLNALDFTLSGKIIDTYVRVGNVRQHTYTFQLSLTDKQGLAVWEEEKEVTKGFKRPGVGG